MGLGAWCRWRWVIVSGCHRCIWHQEGMGVCVCAVMKPPVACMCMRGGTNSCRALIYGAAPLLWSGGPAMSCISPHPQAGGMQLYLAPRGALRSGDAGDPWLSQVQVDSGEEGHHDAGAVSQGQSEVCWARGPPRTPVQWAPMGGAGPGAMCRQGNKLLHATAWAVQHMCMRVGAGLCLPGAEDTCRSAPW